MPHSSTSDEVVVRQYRDHRQKQVAECAKRAAKKILAKMKGGRPSEATLAELIAGEFEELSR
jgi:predicted RNA-binding protein Jag